MSTELRREIRTAFEADLEPSPQLAGWVFLATPPKRSRGPLLARYAAAAAALLVVGSAGVYVYRFGIPGITPAAPAGPPVSDGQALSTGAFSSPSSGWIVKRASSSTPQQPGVTTDVVYQTTDGGRTWAERLRFKGEYDWMTFTADGRTGVVWGVDNTTLGATASSCRGGVGSGCTEARQAAIVYRTVDGGLNWTRMPPPAGSFYTGAFLNPDVGWIVTSSDGPGGSMEVWFTSDGGASWQLRGQPSFAAYSGYGIALGTGNRSLVFADDLHGWLVPNTYAPASIAALLATADGGLTWQGLTLSLPVGVSGEISAGSPRLFGDGTGILPLAVRTAAANPQGPEPASTIYLFATTDGGATWGSPRPLFPTGSPQAEEKVVGTMGVWDFWDARHWWVMNQTGTGGGPWAPRPHLLTTVDGGRTWKTYDNSPDISDVFFVSPTAGWAEDQTDLGNGFVNGLIRTTDGGAHWTRVAIPIVR